MRKIFLLSSVLLLTFFSVSAQAKNGIYITLESGWAQQTDLPDISNSGANRITGDSLPSAFRGGIGYNHDITRWLGVGMDVGIGRYGHETYFYNTDQTDVRTRTLEFLGLIQFHLRKWDLFFKGGGIRETVFIKGHDAQDKQTQSRPEFGLGLAYNFTPHLAAILDYDHIIGTGIPDFPSALNKTPSLNELMLGIRVSFC